MLFVVLVLVIFPFLTYYVSRNSFYRKASSQALAKSPPTLPYLLPGVFHAFSLAYEGPQKYFATVIKNYGTFSPFSIKVGSRSFVVLRDPQQLKNVMQSTNSKRTGLDAYKNILGLPEPALRCYAGEGSSPNDKNILTCVHDGLLRKYLEGAALIPLGGTYITILSHNMHDKMFQVGTWTLIEDFWSFFQQVITKCTIETLFGSAFLKQYPRFVKDFWAFEDAIEGFIPGMPRVLMSATHETSRDRLLQGIEKWLKANHSGSDFAKIEHDDPIWDQYKGSRFIQELDDTFAKMNEFDTRARAAEILAVMQCSVTTSVSSVSWTMVEILRRPDLAKHLKTEIAKYYSSQSDRPELTGISSMPVLQSIQAEVERLRMAKYLVRYVDVGDCRIDGLWTIPRGAFAVTFSNDVALNTNLWAKAQPRTVEQPLKDFWPERFLTTKERPTDPRAHRQKRSDSLTSTKFSLDGLDLIMLALRGDHYAHMGSDYIRAIQAATLTVFLTEFEIHLCDPEAVDAAIPSVEDSAYGRVKLLDKVAVRIRKRTADESR